MKDALNAIIALTFSLLLASPSSAQTVTAQIREDSTVGTCTHPVGSCTSCYNTFTFSIVWNRTAPAGYQWAPVTEGGFSGSSGFVIGNGGDNEGSAPIFTDSGNYASAPCNTWLKTQEQVINSQQWTAWAEVTAPDGTKTTVRSNVAQLSNPSGT